MGIFSDFLNKRKEKKASAEEAKFIKLDDEKRDVFCKKILAMKGDDFEKAIEKYPFVLPYIVGDVKETEINKAVDIATKKGVSVYDLVDKNVHTTNAEIVNIAVKNQLNLISELDDMPALQDLVTLNTFIEVFVKNPEVIFSNCKLLKNRITIKGTNKDGSEGTRVVTLKSQLQRAMNIYFRPESCMKNGYDSFAKSIAERITGNDFAEKIAGNKMTTRSATAANETLKRSPEKGRVVPAKALRNWNNRVLYTIPNQAKRKISRSPLDLNYSTYSNYMFGLMSNPALNSFTEKEKTKLAKRCVTICPELYFELSKIKGFEKIAEKLTVQLSAYETFKDRQQFDDARLLLYRLGEKQEKKVLARSEANMTRKLNKRKKVLPRATHEKIKVL